MRTNSKGVQDKLNSIYSLTFHNMKTGGMYTFKLHQLKDSRIEVTYNGDTIGTIIFGVEFFHTIQPTIVHRHKKPIVVLNWCWTRLQQDTLPDYIHITIRVWRKSKKALAYLV